MEITFNTKHGIASLTVESGTATITEEIKVNLSVCDSLIGEFIAVANAMSRHNGVSDVDFVKFIFNNFLSESEQDAFLERVLE